MPNQEGQICQLELAYSSVHTVFFATFYLIIVEYHCLIRESRLSVLIPHLVTLYLLKHTTSLVMVLLCLLLTNALACDSRALHSPIFF